MALKFNGAGQFGNAALIPLTAAPLTMSAWFKPAGQPGSNSIMAITDGTSAINCWWLTTQLNYTNLYATAPAATLWNAIGVTLIPSGTIAYTGGVAGGYVQNATSKSINYNVTGNYTLLFVITAEASDTIGSAYLAGTQMTLLVKSFSSAVGWAYCFGMANAPNRSSRCQCLCECNY